MSWYDPLRRGFSTGKAIVSTCPAPQRRKRSCWNNRNLSRLLSILQPLRGERHACCLLPVKPCPCCNRYCWQNPWPGESTSLQLIQDASQATTTSNRETTNLPRLGDMDICVSSGLSQPPARSLSLTHYAFPSPTPPSAPCSVQHSPPSPDSCCLPTAVDIKGGGIEEDKIFLQPQQLPLHCCSWDRDSLSRHSSSTSLGLRCFVTGGSRTGRFYCWIMTDFGFKPSAEPGHAAHLNLQPFCTQQGEKIPNSRANVLDSVVSLSNIKSTFCGHNNSKSWAMVEVQRYNDSTGALPVADTKLPNSPI